MSTGEKFFSIPVRLVVHFTCNPGSELRSREIAALFECESKDLSTRLKPAVEAGAIEVHPIPGNRWSKVYRIGPALSGIRDRAMRAKDAA